MRRLGFGLALLAFATGVEAAPVSCPGGLLTTTPLAALNAASQNVFVTRSTPAAAFQAVVTAGTATVQIQICCMGNCDPTTGAWAVVAGSDMAITPTASLARSVTDPTCQYRGFVSACTGCAGVEVSVTCSGAS